MKGLVNLLIIKENTWKKLASLSMVTSLPKIIMMVNYHIENKAFM